MGLPRPGLAEPLARRYAGSTGKAAVIDTAWGLYKEHSRRGATLKGTGRDMGDRIGSVAALLEAERRVGTRIKLELEARWFMNVDPANTLGAFDRDSHVTLRVSRFF